MRCELFQMLLEVREVADEGHTFPDALMCMHQRHLSPSWLLVELTAESRLPLPIP